MKIQKSICAVIIGSTLGSAHAIEVSGLTLSGEAAFDYNLVSTKDEPIPGAGGAKDNEYRLNYAQLLLRKKVDKLSFFSRLFYLPTTYESNGSEATANLGVLYQLEVFYRIHPKFDIGFGRFLTTMGYESPFRTSNHTYNYTIARQTLYPAYADGIRARYIVNDEITATLSSYNRFADNSFGDDNRTSKATEIALKGSHGIFTWYGGYQTSRDTNATEKIDNKATSAWISYRFIEQASFIAAYDNRSAESDSSSLKYAQSVSGTLTYDLGIHHLAFRYELVSGANDINDINGAANFQSADKVDSITLTDKIAINENLNLYLEYRGDKADEKAFVKGNGGLVKNASMFTVGAIAHF